MTDKDTIASKPLVSIGLPIYNEEIFLSQVLESLLSQDYDNFEIVICNNASTDSTPEICKEWMIRDSRIRYHQNEENIGAADNFSLAFKLSRGEYFMWASGHDLWEPGFISNCLAPLLDDADTSLCYPQLQWIDYEGGRLAIEELKADTRGLGISRRFLQAIWRQPQNAIFGLMRKSSLEMTRLVRKTVGPDQVLLVELAIIGAFVQVDQPLFLRRRNRPSETIEQSRERRVGDVWGKHKPKDAKMLYWKFVFEIIAGAYYVTTGLQRVWLLLIATPITLLRFGRLLLRDLLNYIKG